MVERTTQPPVHGDAPIEAIETEKETGELPDLAKLVEQLDLKDTSLVVTEVPAGLEGKERAKARDAQRRAQEQVQVVDQFAGRIKVDFAAVLPGYMFDRLTREQKIMILRSPAAKDLPFADRLRVPGTEILVLGKDDYDPPDPIGDDRTAVQEWVKAVTERYAADNDKMVATLKDGKFSIGKFEEKDGVFKRIHGVKRDVPIVCGTGSNGTAEVNKLAMYIDIRKRGIPDIPKKTTWTRCDIAELLAREQNNIVWYTPEEMDVLTKLKTKTSE